MEILLERNRELLPWLEPALLDNLESLSISNPCGSLTEVPLEAPFSVPVP